MKLMLTRCLVIGAAGFVGAIARYLVGLGFSWVPVAFPLGTFVINVTGCMILGWFIAFGQAHNIKGSLWYPAISVGFVGAYTTFSTFVGESNQLAKDGAWNLVSAYFIGSLAVGVVAFRLGAMLARWT